MPVEEVGGLGDHQGVGDQRTRVSLEHGAAGVVVGVAGVSGGDEHAGVDEQHSVESETLGQQFVGLCAASGMPGRADGHESQMALRRGGGLRQDGGEGFSGESVGADPTAGRLEGQTVDQLVG